MHLFPEPAYRTGRRVLIVAAILSLLFHLVGGAIWGFFLREVVAKAASHARQAPEAIAFSDAITIEHRTVPRPSRRAQSPHAVPPQPHPAPAPPPVRTVVKPKPRELPTAPPIAFTKPRIAPSQRVVVHRQIAQRPTPPQPNHNAFSSEQMASLDAQFSRTINAAQRAVSEGPQQRGEASDVRQQQDIPAAERRRYDQLLAGSPEEVKAKMYVGGDGSCVPIQGPFTSGRMQGYYIRCLVHYTDGFFEQVSFPWPFYFPPHKNPFDEHDNPNGTMTFPGQDPPGGFTLPANFALTRTVCAYFRPQCTSVINAEINRGEASYGKPP
ncbi:MAG: hypothetical protein JWN27_285 [Candidatus Eremiobacteraeota bacterium]|nr:hypothetical protein [Candidatus Eremiobacteraeota bacterium]